MVLGIWYFLAPLTRDILCYEVNHESYQAINPMNVMQRPSRQEPLTCPIMNDLPSRSPRCKSVWWGHLSFSRPKHEYWYSLPSVPPFFAGTSLQSLFSILRTMDIILRNASSFLLLCSAPHATSNVWFRQVCHLHLIKQQHNEEKPEPSQLLENQSCCQKFCTIYSGENNAYKRQLWCFHVQDSKTCLNLPSVASKIRRRPE